jgi:small subunit ribosomal protein S17e
MGNIRPTYIKSLASKLLAEYGDEFGVDFEENKHKVTEYTNVRSKTIRNRVAGYIVRQKRIQMRTK